MRRIVLLFLPLLLLASCEREEQQKPRFVWIDAAANFAYYGDSEENIAVDCKRIAESGFTDIIVDVRPTSGDVLFKSAVAPELKQIARWKDGALRFVQREASFDYLQAFIDSGHAAGLKVHAAVNVMVGGFWSPGTGPGGMVYDHPELKDWCAVDYTSAGLVNHADDKTTIGGRFLDPANPAVQDFLLRMLADLAAYKELDGIVLDRCRYDDYAMDAGYTESARKAFSAYIGREPERWPVFAEPGHIFLEGTPDELEVSWMTFRCKVIHDFVARARDAVKAVNTSLPFEIYVGAWFSEYYRSGVNWTSPEYDIFCEPAYAQWVTEDYRKTGFADLFDYMFLGTYTGAHLVHGDTEKTMEGYARLGRQRLAGAVPFAAGPDLGNEAGFRDGPQHQVIPDVVNTMLSEADGLFVFDLCHIRMYDYWNDFISRE